MSDSNIGIKVEGTSRETVRELGGQIHALITAGRGGRTTRAALKALAGGVRINNMTFNDTNVRMEPMADISATLQALIDGAGHGNSIGNVHLVDDDNGEEE